MTVRRVVLGKDGTGRSFIAQDGAAPEVIIAAGRNLAISDIWGSDGQPHIPPPGASPAYTRFFPPVQGFRVMVMTVQPEQSGTVDPEAYQAERTRLLAGYDEDVKTAPDHPGLHETDTVDVGVVLTGEIDLTLDSGIVTTLRQGDFFVQNAGRHRWDNRGSEACSLAIFVVGAGGCSG